MSKPVSLYQQYWSDKRYLKMLTCRKACGLNHSERIVLSFLLYKARDKSGVGTKTITKALGLDRRTVWAATRRLIDLGLAARAGQGFQALDPLTIRPEWFAAPHDAKDWWERPRTYRHYLLTDAAKRSRGNRDGCLTEMDNAVLWMLYSLGKGGKEVVGQRVAGLATLLGCSPHTLRDAIDRLTTAGLVMKRSYGFTLLAPDEAVRSWWRDRPKKEQASVVPITEAGAPLAWIESLVADRFPSDSDDDRDTLARMVEKCSQQMLDGRVKPAETKKYWQGVLQMIPDADKAFDFCTIDWDVIRITILED
jgi:Mn-dependent DtxR family transcriptional regulator